MSSLQYRRERVRRWSYSCVNANLRHFEPLVQGSRNILCIRKSVKMTNLHFVCALVALYASVSITALRVTINGKDAGMSRCNSIIHQPIKLPVWPVWSGVVAQCFDWIKAPQISESIVSSIGGRVVPITLSNLDVSPFLLLAHHCHSFTPLDPIRSARYFSHLQPCHDFLQWNTFH